ncbi:MAG: hypothetical protein ABW020_13480 [Candidatus Rokuibacteriota bacterium]
MTRPGASARARRALLAHAMTAPVVGLLVAVVVVPELAALGLSLHRYTYGQPPAWIGAGNYAQLWADPAFWNALRNNILFVAAAVLLELGVGLAMATVLKGSRLSAP